VAKASPPTTGSFSVNWNGEKIDNVSSALSAKEFQDSIQSFKNMGFVSVIRSKDCAGYKWRIKWVNGGDKPQLQVFIFIYLNRLYFSARFFF
jgi:hypothetical protein